MQRALVLAAGLRVRAPEREVDRAADLLVEEDRADRAVDAEVRADADLAQARAPSSVGQRALQVVVAALGARRDDLAVAQLELDAGDVDARTAPTRTSKRTRPFALVSCGPVKTSPLGHVALAVGVDPRAALRR